jgi:putative tryptophan/tyrosine transport system substrate-binding protein
MALMANVGNPVAILEIDQIQASARTIALEVIPLEIRRGEDIVPAFEALKDRAEALYVVIDPLTNSNRVRINTLALAERLPTMHAIREGVEAGGLMSYGPNVPDLFRRAGDYVVLHRQHRTNILSKDILPKPGFDLATTQHTSIISGDDYVSWRRQST